MFALCTGVDFSKILRDKPKFWEQQVVITDESMGVSLLLGAHAGADPLKVYAYGSSCFCRPRSLWSTTE